MCKSISNGLLCLRLLVRVEDNLDTNFFFKFKKLQGPSHVRHHEGGLKKLAYKISKLRSGIWT